MKKTFTSNQRGAFLVEVILGGGLLIGIAIAASSFYKTRLKSQTYMEKLRNLDTFHSYLTQTLHNTGHCNSTFKEWDQSTVVPGSLAKDVKRIWLCSNNCTEKFTTSTVQRNSSPLLTEATARPSDETEWLPFQKDTLTIRSKDWILKDLGMVPLTKSGKGTLKFLYELFPGTSDSKKVLKTIDLYFKFTPLSNGTPVFISCGSGKESSLRSVLQEMCESMSRVASAPSGSTILGEWDYGEQECNLNPSPRCGLNEAIKGVDKDGLLTCQSLTKDVEGMNLYQPNEENCSGSLKPSIIIDVDGKLRISCI
jgi:hypothetical protein